MWRTVVAVFAFARTLEAGSAPVGSGMSLSLVCAETVQSNVLGDLVTGFSDRVLPITRRPPATGYVVLYPWQAGPSGFCPAEELNGTGPVFVRSAVRSLATILHASAVALGGSCVQAASVLGGLDAAEKVQAVDNVLGNVTATALNNATVDMVAELTCLGETGQVNDVLLARMSAGATMYKAHGRDPLQYSGWVWVYGDVTPVILSAVGSCSHTRCEQSVPVASNVSSSLLDMAPAIAKAAAACHTLQLCATASAALLVNVEGCHYEASYTSLLQAQYRVQWTCQYF